MKKIRTNKFLEFIADWGTLLILVYFVITVLFTPDQKHMLNEHYIFSATYAGPFIALFIIYISLYRWQFQQQIIQKISIICGAVFSWIALCAGTAGIFVLINTSLGINNTHCFEGKVVDKWHTKTFFGEFYYLRITDENVSALRSLEVTETQYQNSNTGNVFKDCWVEGSLGLLYKER